MSILNFMSMSYAGQKSEDFGIMHGTIGGSVFLEDIFLPSRSILEEKVRDNPNPYFMGTEMQPLEFDMTLIFEEHYNDRELREVKRWLFNHQYYQELYFGDDYDQQPEKIYYALITGDSKLYHNAHGEGYFTVHVRCDSPYGYAPQYLTNEYDQINSDIPIGYNIPDLSTGVFEQTRMNGNSVELNATEKKWSDFPEDATWLDTE